MNQVLQNGEMFRDSDGNEYEILETLEEGNMAIVYLACPPSLPLLRYAIKTVKPLEQTDPKVKAEFLHSVQRERLLLEQVAQLRHSNIAVLCSSGMGPDDMPYMILEQFEGEPLHARLQRSAPLAFAQALQITLQLGEALTALHALGIALRELSTRNVFLCHPSAEADPEAGLVKLVNFGVARFAGLTLYPDADGSSAYLSPEQAAGSQVIDVRVDQFALAALLLEMLTGQPVFAGQSKNAQQEPMRVQIEDPAAHIAALPIPPAAHRALTQALDKDPRQRFRSIAEFLNALQGKEPTQAKRSVVPGPVPGAASAPQPLALPGFRSYLLLALLVCVCGLLAYKTATGSASRGQVGAAAKEASLPKMRETPAVAPTPVQQEPVQAVIVPPVTAVAVVPLHSNPPAAPAQVSPRPAPTPPAPQPAIELKPYSPPSHPLPARGRLVAVKVKPTSKSTSSSSAGSTQPTWRAEPRFSNKATPATTVSAASAAVSQCLEKQRQRGRLPQDCTMTLSRSRSQGKYLMNDTDCEIRSYEFAMSLEICVSENVRTRAIEPQPDSFWIQISSGASQ